MGMSTNSHGKKSDKETQSPVLKIFKEIMMRENNDPEKRNLLDQKDDKKRKPYSGMRSKLERRSCESSSSEHRKKKSYNVMAAEKKNICKEKKNICEEKENPCLKGQTRAPDDTCSCVSCALKRIVGSEYACVGLLMLIFILTIVAACVFIFKNVPMSVDPLPLSAEMKTGSQKPDKAGEGRSDDVTDSDRLKRKIERINDKRIKNELSQGGVFGEPHYDSIRSDLMELPGSSEIDFGRSLLERSGTEDVENEIQSDIGFSTVLEPVKIDKQGSDKLKEFYAKLIETDAKIKKLKKVIASQHNTFKIDADKTPDRTKRSLKLYEYPKGYQIVRRRIDFYDRNNEYKHRNKRKIKLKRQWHRNGTDDSPTGFVIEKKKLIIQYQPNDIGKKLVAKCSHTPKDLHSHQHENQLKHPFYQNTQRLDELLDRFLNKNLPEIMSDPFGLDFLFQHGKNKCKHPSLNPNKTVHIIDKTQQVKSTTKEPKKTTTKNVSKSKNTHKELYNDYKLLTNTHSQIPKPKAKAKKVTEATKTPMHETTDPDLMKLLMPEATTQYERNFFHHHEDDMMNKEEPRMVTARTDDREVLLNVPTMNHPELITAGKVTSLMDRVPNLRRLMQIDGEDDESLGYEDFKEVLTDDIDNQDDVDRRADRRKRDDEDRAKYTDVNDVERKVTKYNPPGVHNPNWKGPMPLYPDELNTMIQQAAMNANKIKPKYNLPEESDPLVSSTNRIRRDSLSDVGYVEDYLDNKYDKLVEMAQAYSDYGVLEGKKESVRNEKNPATEYTSSEHRVKLSAGGFLSNRGLFGRKKKEQYGATTTTTSTNTLNQSLEGLSDEGQPTAKTLDDLEAALSKLLNNTNKISHDEPIQNTVTYRQKMKARLTPNKAKKKAKKDRNKPEKLNTSNSSIFSFAKGRSLLSTLFKSPDGVSEWNDFEEASPINDIDDDLYSISKSNIYSILNNSFLRPGQEKDNLKHPNKKVLTVSIKPSIAYLDVVEHVSTTEVNNNRSRLTKTRIHSSNYTGGQTKPRMESNGNTNDSIKAEPKSSESVEPGPKVDISSNVSENYDNKTVKAEEIPTESIEVVQNKNISDPEFDTAADKVKFIDELERNRVLESEQNENETLVTIARSEMKPKDIDGKTYEGVISLTLKIPDVGIENIELSFDSPLPNVMNDQQYLSDEYNDDVDCSISYHAEKNTPSYTGSLGKDIEELNRSKRDAKSTTEIHNIAVISNTTKVNEIVGNKTELPEERLVNGTILASNETKNNNMTSKQGTEKDNMSLSDFFMMISDWFRTLDGSNVKNDRSKLNSGSDIAVDFLSEVNNFANQNKSSTNTTTELSYPLYDSDMIENIGHRSRVLLALNDANATDDKGTSETEDIKVTGAKSANITGNDSNSTTTVTSTTTLITNNTATEKDIHTTTSAPTKDSNARKVKRNAEDSNLIFWNDIYDDEYGLQTENLDGVIKDKPYSKNRHDFIKRSGRWVQDKIKKFAQNLKGGDQMVALKERTPRAANNIKKGRYIQKNIHRRISEKSSNNDEENYDLDPTSVFNKLGANMMQVCKKAARAVKQTSNIEVKEDMKQSSIATGLMQQVVNLLTDLVDYQVQAKTCTKLPADLQNFLEWLTDAEEEGRGDTERKPEGESQKSIQPSPEENVIDNIDDVVPPGQATEGEKVDFKPQYLDTLRSIQDLLDQYEEMNDDDKSKMTGVKFYLQNQLRFLNKMLSGSELFDLFEKQDLPLLYKREVIPFRRPKVRRKRKLYKFIKNFGKKHTRTTASFYDGVLVTEMKKSAEDSDPKIDGFNRIPRGQLTKAKNVRRNLKDVYYKAVAEAKKYSTAKNGHRKQMVVDYSTTKNARDHN